MIPNQGVIGSVVATLMVIYCVLVRSDVLCHDVNDGLGDRSLRWFGRWCLLERWW